MVKRGRRTRQRKFRSGMALLTRRKTGEKHGYLIARQRITVVVAGAVEPGSSTRADWDGTRPE